MSKKKDKGDDAHREEIVPQVADQDLKETGFAIIEEGVRSLVQVLCERGYWTVCSCAGHTKGLEPLPWITILIEGEDPFQLLRLVQAVGRFNLSQGKGGRLPQPADTWVLGPQQMVNGGMAIYLRPQSLNEKRDRQELLHLREMGEKLSLFIKHQCRDLFPLT